MYFAANGIPVAAGYTDQATFPSQGWFQTPFNRFSGFVNGTDVVCQILEEQGGWQMDSTQEILLRQGFNSRDMPGFVAIRFRVWPQTLLPLSGTVDMAAMSL